MISVSSLWEHIFFNLQRDLLPRRRQSTEFCKSFIGLGYKGKKEGEGCTLRAAPSYADAARTVVFPVEFPEAFKERRGAGVKDPFWKVVLLALQCSHLVTSLRRPGRPMTTFAGHMNPSERRVLFVHV